MKLNDIELLAPGGDIDAIKAAIIAGADAIYCGLDRFNARNRAANISFDDLQGILRLAHKNNCKIYLTLNVLITDSEIPAIINLLNKLVNTGIDGVIIQDLGLFYLISKYFPSLKIHASTQVTTHNEGQIKFLAELDAVQVNLSRELNIDEIKSMTSVCDNYNIRSEVFVHGSYCLSFSGLCYMSSVQTGSSGNRGRCSQPCRDKYVTTLAGKDYPLNLKDNSAYFDLIDLAEAGVDSLKIEGRIKKSDYVFTVVDSWRKQLNSYYKTGSLLDDNRNLYKVYNRNFSNSYLKGSIGRDMFIDNPRDHSVKHLSEINIYNSESELEKDSIELYDEKDEIKNSVESKIGELSIAKGPLNIDVSGKINEKLKVSVETPDFSFDVYSDIPLVKKISEELNYNEIFKRFKAFNETECYINSISLDNLEKGVSIPFNELTAIKKRVLFFLNGRESIDPVKIPLNNKQTRNNIKTSVSVLISSADDIDIFKNSSTDLFFKLPVSFKNGFAEMVDLFNKNINLIPWFQSVLIGEDYYTALEFIDIIKPEIIVTDNTGISYEAYRKGIKWIAGPYMNIVNSYSLLCLKEKYNCSGSFISNEISKNQIRSIIAPEDFRLFYSIYHPVLLMTSRQCMFHQVIGCEKNIIDESCIENCEKYSSITNLKGEKYFIEKSKGNYHCIYNGLNYLNTNIINDLPDIFSDYLIDLRNIKTKTSIVVDKKEILNRFIDIKNRKSDSDNEIHNLIKPTSCSQYEKGI